MGSPERSIALSKVTQQLAARPRTEPLVSCSWPTSKKSPMPFLKAAWRIGEVTWL